MPRVSPEEHRATLEWAHTYRGSHRQVPGRLSMAALSRAHGDDLRRYFALCALSRNQTAPESLASDAYSQVFRVRVALERSIRSSADEALARHDEDFAVLLHKGFYGASRKQGVSVRMALST